MAVRHDGSILPLGGRADLSDDAKDDVDGFVLDSVGEFAVVSCDAGGACTTPLSTGAVRSVGLPASTGEDDAWRVASTVAAADGMTSELVIQRDDLTVERTIALPPEVTDLPTVDAGGTWSSNGRYFLQPYRSSEVVALVDTATGQVDVAHIDGVRAVTTWGDGFAVAHLDGVRDVVSRVPARNLAQRSILFTVPEPPEQMIGGVSTEFLVVRAAAGEVLAQSRDGMWSQVAEKVRYLVAL